MGHFALIGEKDAVLFTYLNIWNDYEFPLKNSSQTSFLWRKKVRDCYRICIVNVGCMF